MKYIEHLILFTLCIFSLGSYAAVCNTGNFYHGVTPTTVYPVDQMLCNVSYNEGYNYQLRSGLYSAAHLTKEHIAVVQQRKNTFHEDTRIPVQYRTHLKEYRGTKMDRSHMENNADAWSTESMYATFSLANMVPAPHSVNAGKWLDTENKARDLATQYGEVYVVSGNIFNDAIPDVGKLNQPDMIYKAILIPSTKDLCVYSMSNRVNGEDFTILSQDQFSSKFNGIVPFPTVGYSCDSSKFTLQ